MATAYNLHLVFTLMAISNESLKPDMETDHNNTYTKSV